MKMNDNNCIIGLLYISYDDSSLVTVKELHKYIQEEIVEYNEMLRKNGMAQYCRKEWTIKDYADWRKNTNLKRFAYCPDCGQPIDWGNIRRRFDNEIQEL